MSSIALYTKKNKLEMTKKCQTCTKYLWDVHKKRCDDCVMKTDMKFKTCIISTFDNVCGGTYLYRVTPKEGVDRIRLHHILYWLIDHYEAYTFTPIYQWEPIWKSCKGWVDPKLEQIHKGKLQRGIMYHDGNGVIAAVQDKKGDLYVVHGSWG